MGMVQLLLRCEAFVDVEESRTTDITVDLRQPIHLAAQQLHLPLVQLLLETDADSSCVDHFGRTVLHWVCESDAKHTASQVKSLTDCLVAHNAELNAHDKDGFSALHYCAKRGIPELVQALLRHKCVVDCSNNVDRSTPLMTALDYSEESPLEKKRIFIVMALIRAGATSLMQHTVHGYCPAAKLSLRVRGKFLEVQHWIELTRNCHPPQQGEWQQKCTAIDKERRAGRGGRWRSTVLRGDTSQFLTRAPEIVKHSPRFKPAPARAPPAADKKPMLDTAMMEAASSASSGAHSVPGTVIRSATSESMLLTVCQLLCAGAAPLCANAIHRCAVCRCPRLACRGVCWH
eukprot:TRINITY_DN4871_c0_g1_i3.p1 TRINITY_DN4871_c0_g1~~TRINITY_DN4871_c0_g1_i3.p1  ORF type:complete len:346 (+),score=84.25 TRINITY_DN4871_c0_g1_i3:226-1263(+)